MKFIEITTETGIVIINLETILRVHIEDNIVKVVVNNSINSNYSSIIVSSETIESIREKLSL